MAGGRRDAGESLTPGRLPISRGEAAAFAGAVVAFALLRLPLLERPGLLRGWNSDAAVFGLMAKAIAEGRGFPIFFWGQSYMGPLTSWVTVAASLVTGSVGPLALRLAASAEVLGGVFFYWLALRRAWGALPAIAAVLWLAIGPEYFVRFTFAPIGAEQMFLLSGAVVWLTTRRMLAAGSDWFWFGVLAGFGWWINQGIVFTVAGAIGIAVLRSEWWRRVRPGLQPLARLGLSAYRCGRPLRILLTAINLILMGALLLGALRAAGFRVPAAYVADPLAEPLAALAVFHLAVAAGFGYRMPRPPLGRAALFAGGFVLGYLPVIVGGLIGLYPPRYGFSAPALSLAELPAHLRAVSGDLWAFLGAGGAGGRLVVAVVLVPLLVIAVVRHRQRVGELLTLRSRDWGPRAVGAATIVCSVLFYVLSQRAYGGTMRYVVAALPFAYAFAAAEAFRWRAAGGAITAVVMAALLIAATGDVRDVAEGRMEGYGGFAPSFAPEPVIKTIVASGYAVCYADYWSAYKLEWVSEGRVAFIPWRSYDRTPAESIRRHAMPGKKCFVDSAGSVVPADTLDLEGATSRTARERLRRLGGASLASRPVL